MSNVITWFEIPTTDINRAAQFYSTILAMKVEATDFNGHQMAFFPFAENAISGALVQEADIEPCTKGTVVYFDGGDDLNNVLAKVPDAGGQVLLAKTKVNDEIGYIAFVLDTEGNKIGLHSRG